MNSAEVPASWHAMSRFVCPILHPWSHSPRLASTTTLRFGPIMHSPHRAIFRRRRLGSGAKTTEADDEDEEGGGNEDGAGGMAAGASDADGGPGLVDEHGNDLRPGLMANKATWDRCVPHGIISPLRRTAGLGQARSPRYDLPTRWGCPTGVLTKSQVAIGARWGL